MTEANITLVHPVNITPLWDKVEPLLQKAISMGGTHTPENVRSSLLSGNAQLWVQWTKQSVDTAAVTEFIPYPLGTRVRVWLSGAKPGCEAQWTKLDTYISDFARANRCIGMEIIARKGWGRTLANCEESAALFVRNFTYETIQ